MRDALNEADGVRDEASTSAASPETSTASQGRYVVPFTLTREEETCAAELCKQQLDQLVAECSRPPTSPSSNNASTSGWERVASSKKATGVALWEKGVVHSKRVARKSREKPVVARRRASAPPVETSGTAAANSDSKSTDELGLMTYSVRSSVRVCASLDTVLQTLDTSVATAHRSFTKIIYENIVADASVLYHSSIARCEDASSMESLAVRWLVCRCSNPLASDADLCLREYTRRHSADELAANSKYYSNNRDASYSDSARHAGLHAADELPAAYKLFRSTETRYCPELLESHRLMRCKVPLGGFLFYPTDHCEQTDVVFYLSLEQDRTQCSDRQFRALQLLARHMALQVGRLANAVDAFYMGQRLEALRAQRWVRNDERTECVVCFRRFHQLTRRRHHCRLCGEVICRDCSVHKDVDLPTVGPTVLRICSSCDSTGSLRLEPPTTELSSPVALNPLRSHTTAQQESLGPTTAAASASRSPERRRVTLDVDNSKSVESDSRKDVAAGRRFTTAGSSPQRRQVATEALSCPKPLVDRRYFATKWGNSRALATPLSPTVATAPSTPQAAAATSVPLAMHRCVSETSRMTIKSCSKTASTREHIPPRFWDDSPPRSHDAANNDSSDRDDKFESVSRRSGAALALSPSVRAKVGASPSHWAKSSVSNQQLEQEHEARRGGLRADQEPEELRSPASTASRDLGDLKHYQDVLLKLCQDATAVRGSNFAALTLFTHSEDADRLKQSNETDSRMEAGATHYLLVKGTAKLLEVAANLRCCEPVLQLGRPMGTRNAWKLETATSRHVSGVDFRALPVVAGPQRARFYAGVPLLDAKKRVCYGALAIFDAAVVRGEDDDVDMQRTLQKLQSCAGVAMNSIGERRRELELRNFLQMPLVRLRRSEPAIRLTTELEHAASYWQGGVVGKQESLDGDSDAEADAGDVEEQGERERLEAEGSEAPASEGGASADKSRVEYFRSRMQELVRQAEDTQAQVVENSLAMERHGVSIS